MARKHEMDLVWEAEEAAMTTGPWPKPKDRSGTTFITVDGVRYQFEGTGLSTNSMMKKIKAGTATAVKSHK